MSKKYNYKTKNIHGFITRVVASYYGWVFRDSGLTELPKSKPYNASKEVFTMVNRDSGTRSLWWVIKYML